MKNNNLPFKVLSIFPEGFKEIFEKIYQKYRKERERYTSNSQEIVWKDFISEEDASFLRQSFLNIPYIRLEDNELPRNNYFKNNEEFNIFLEKIWENIKSTVERPFSIPDYCSRSLFEKIANNNYNIKENPQSAAIFFEL